MARQRGFGRKQSIRLAMHQTECIPTDSSRKLHMSSSPGRNQIYHTFESLVANASFIRRKCLVSLRVDVMKVSFLGYASNSKAYSVFNQTSGLVEETCDVEFDESNGSQEEVVGYDNVGDDETFLIYTKHLYGTPSG